MRSSPPGSQNSVVGHLSRIGTEQRNPRRVGLRVNLLAGVVRPPDCFGIPDRKFYLISFARLREVVIATTRRSSGIVAGRHIQAIAYQNVQIHAPAPPDRPYGNGFQELGIPRSLFQLDAQGRGFRKLLKMAESFAAALVRLGFRWTEPHRARKPWQDYS